MRAGRVLAMSAGAVTAAGAAAAAAAAGVGLRSAYRVFHPPRGKEDKPPEDEGLTARTTEIVTSRDGVRLSAWIVPGEGPHTVIVCHGMGRNKSSVLGHVRLLHDLGHHVVAYDLRNHGDSGNDRALTRMADRFSSDLADVLRTVSADPVLGTGGFAVLACSFSTWPAVHFLPHAPVPVSAVICDSGPTSDVRCLFRTLFDLGRPAMPLPLRHQPAFGIASATFERAVTGMLGVRGWPTDLTGIATGLLFIAGERDPVVPALDVASFAERYSQATVWVSPKARHINAVRVESGEYVARVDTLLQRAFMHTDGRERGARPGG